MSDRGGRGHHGGRSGGERGRNNRGGNRGRGGHHGQQQEKPRKESILDLSKYAEKKIRVRCTGGREVIGTLKGYDQLLNLVLDDTEEYLKDLETAELTKETRKLGLAVIRGTAVIIISPLDGTEEIANPFAQNDE